jgi:ribokinase
MNELVKVLKKQQRGVVVVGSANVDMVAKVPRLPKEGESIRGDSLSIVYGGKGANQAVSLARLGARLQFVCCIGKDYFGKCMKKSFRTEGISTTAIKESSDAFSGTALIFVDKDGKNSIVVIPGANHDLKPEDILKQKRLFREGEIFLTQLELLPETIETAIIQAKESGLVTVVDAGPPREISKQIFPYIDVLSPNETETEFLVGKKPETKKDFKECAEKLLDMGVQSVVLKLGVRGCYYYDGSDELFLPGFKVDVVDTTAAGDAFTSALALAWGQASLDEVLQFANAAGALACTKFGAQPSMPRLDEVLKFLRSNGC